ncbi:WXG100 family type VII secretion target [Nocardia sp. NEAU-G5]|uniref:WXG100 family type VII secretion target n=1 Tax=Nocardia albiluteola TaxID=2842303 RepID=A0ABS6BCR2_9NOCA|nr:WXG100 family type VII secretion target [Nocardia albiluteola]MBU3068079.1 WXG100 family type VII secretion target [Nocardia albiluteola]
MVVQNDSGASAQAQQNMGNSVDALRAKIAKITQAVDAAKTGWQGSAFKACANAADAWDAKAKKLNSTLDEITGEVGKGNQSYTGLEGDNEQQFNQLVNTDAPSAASSWTSLRA